MLELVLGGARSGKSAYAEHCAINSNRPVTYIATATALDEEMQRRINRHKQDRPMNWQTIEEPISLGAVLNRLKDQERFIIIDCLTLWMTNLLTLVESRYQEEMDNLFSNLDTNNEIFFVSNEVGMGIIPLGEETRRFVDEAGRLHQRLAAKCDNVTQMIAGIPNRIKHAAKR